METLSHPSSFMPPPSHLIQRSNPYYKAMLQIRLDFFRLLFVFCFVDICTCLSFKKMYMFYLKGRLTDTQKREFFRLLVYSPQGYSDVRYSRLKWHPDC